MALADDIIEASNGSTPTHLELTKDIKSKGGDEIPEGTIVKVIKDNGNGKYAVASPDGTKADVEASEYEVVKK